MYCFRKTQYRIYYRARLDAVKANRLQFLSHHKLNAKREKRNKEDYFNSTNEEASTSLKTITSQRNRSQEWSLTVTRVILEI